MLWAKEERPSSLISIISIIYIYILWYHSYLREVSYHECIINELLLFLINNFLIIKEVHFYEKSLKNLKHILVYFFYILIFTIYNVILWYYFFSIFINLFLKMIHYLSNIIHNLILGFLLLMENYFFQQKNLFFW